MGAGEVRVGHDRVIRELVMVIREGFPARKSQLEEFIKPFFGMKEDLYEVDGGPFLHERMLVPCPSGGRW